MNVRKQLNLIVALMLLPIAIAGSGQIPNLSGVGTFSPRAMLPWASQTIPGATVNWRATVHDDLHQSNDIFTMQLIRFAGLFPAPNWLSEGNQKGEYYGHSVGTAGDVNGDGYADVIVGASNYTNGEIIEGAAFVYYGSPSGLSLIPNWAAESNHGEARFGFSVGTAGDVNGDGYDDVIVGAPDYFMSVPFSGMAAVYHGSASGLSITPNWEVICDQDCVSYGKSVGTAGDVNGDGYDDIIVGTINTSPGYEIAEAIVYHGSTDGLSLNPEWVGEHNQAGSQLSPVTSMAGDVNDDGYDDVLVGVPGYNNGRGAAFVYHGSATGLSSLPNWTYESTEEGAAFGSSVSMAGDVNDDGYSDVIISAHHSINSLDKEGVAFVYHGSATGLSTTQNWTFESNQWRSGSTPSVSSAGDMNGDGYSDVIIGLPGYENYIQPGVEGSASVYHGSINGLRTLPNWHATSDQMSYFGWSVGTAGDVNSDGYDDVIIGDFYYSSNQLHDGLAVVYLGLPTYSLHLPLIMRNP